MKIITCQNLTKNYGKIEVLKGVTTEFHQGEVVTIIGSSGCGKSTFIRCINGLETISGGSLEVMGNDLSSPPLSEKALRQICCKISMVFQHFNLFPHLTILGNLMLAPEKVLGLSNSEFRERALEYLKKVGLTDKANNYPEELSGGQKQRVAIARSLCMNPQVILFDEPTSALDPELAWEVLNVIKQLADEGRTMIIVTHAMGFAKKVSNKILYFKEGIIEESGPPEAIFANPKSESLKSFLGKIEFA